MIKDILIKKSKGEPEEDKKNYKKFILCKLNDNEFLLDILSVKEIVSASQLTPLPGTTGNIMGILNLRGLVVPIVKINLSNDSKENLKSNELIRYVICQTKDELIGLFVDEAQFIIDIEEEILFQAKPLNMNLFSKSIKVESKIYKILDISKVFNEYKIKNQE